MKLWHSHKPTSYAAIPALVMTLFLSGCFADSQAEEKNAVQSTTEKVVNSTAEIKKTDDTKQTNAENTSQSTETDTTANDLIEGKDYVEIFPQMQTDAAPGTVEVIELFWLGCPHCYTLEPFIKNYKRTKADYVDFKAVPAVLNPTWKTHAQAYYTARAVDPENKLQLIDKMFYAIHEQGRRLSSKSAQKRFFKQHGVSESEFDSAYNSMMMNTILARADQVSRTSQATGVPAIIIDGRYRTSAYMAGNEARLLQIINTLTKQAHENR